MLWFQPSACGIGILLPDPLGHIKCQKCKTREVTPKIFQFKQKEVSRKISSVSSCKEVQYMERGKGFFSVLVILKGRVHFVASKTKIPKKPITQTCTKHRSIRSQHVVLRKKQTKNGRSWHRSQASKSS